jgi:peptidoglycan L-alanyl-D-glutamate endopeptidase CwlK
MPLDAKSQKNLAEAHPLLQKVVNQFLIDYPNVAFQINDAQRGRAEQEHAYQNKTSRAHFGQSAHNFKPAVALDIFPKPVQFSKWQPYQMFAKEFLSTARKLGIAITWGGSWTKIKDGPHFELSDWQSRVKRGEVKLI